jgi:hypothetical protein
LKSGQEGVKESRIAGGTACATKTSPVFAVVGQASACQRPLAGAFFHTFPSQKLFGVISHQKRCFLSLSPA